MDGSAAPTQGPRIATERLDLDPDRPSFALIGDRSAAAPKKPRIGSVEASSILDSAKAFLSLAKGTGLAGDIGGGRLACIDPEIEAIKTLREGGELLLPGRTEGIDSGIRVSGSKDAGEGEDEDEDQCEASENEDEEDSEDSEDSDDSEEEEEEEKDGEEDGQDEGGAKDEGDPAGRTPKAENLLKRQRKQLSKAGHVEMEVGLGVFDVLGSADGLVAKGIPQGAGHLPPPPNPTTMEEDEDAALVEEQPQAHPEAHLQVVTAPPEQ